MPGFIKRLEKLIARSYIRKPVNGELISEPVHVVTHLDIKLVTLAFITKRFGT